MSPTAAITAAAVPMSTPGIVSSRAQPGPREGLLGDLLVKLSDLAAQEIDVAQAALHRLGLLLGQLLLGEPHTSLACRTGRSPADGRADSASRRACTSFFIRVRARTSAARRATRRRNASVASSGTHTALSIPAESSLREHRRVETVGLHTRVRDRPRLRRIAHHDPPDSALPQDPRDRHRAAAGLQHHLVLAAETGRELPDRLRCARDPPDLRDPAALSDRDLAEIEVNIQTKEPHDIRSLHASNS